MEEYKNNNIIFSINGKGEKEKAGTPINKQEEIRNNRARTMGRKCRATIAGAKLQVDSAMKSKAFKKMPSLMKENTTDVHQQLAAIQQDAQSAIEHGNDLTHSVDDVSSTVAKATNYYAHASSMMLAAKEMS